MERDRGSGSEVREVRLEGVGLYVMGGLFVAALAGAFYLGRWVERGSAPERTVSAEASLRDAPSPVRQEPKEAGREATHFDTVSGKEQAAEPERQVASGGSKPAESTAPPGTVASAPGESSASERGLDTERGKGEEGGLFFVQIFALRDLGSARGLLDALEDKGFRVRMDTEQEGQGALYKIRLGGYATREQAQAMAERLRGEGYPGAFVTPTP